MFTKLLAPAAVVLCTLLAPLVCLRWCPRQAAVPEAAAGALPAVMAALPGTVVLAGGTFIDPVGEEVIRLAGGNQARLVLIPTAYGPTEEEGVEQFYELWGKYKPAKIDVLHTRDRAVANDPRFVEPLRQATAVWFLGGVQTRLIETYENTLVHREVQRVLERGGVVGGNCAGAMALGETMIVRGEDDPDDDDVVVRPGLAIVPKMIADSHWLERNRVERLRGVIEQHPDHFGLGIDSQTAVVIDHGHLRCIGKSYVATIVSEGSTHDVRFDVFSPGDDANLAELLAAK